MNSKRVVPAFLLASVVAIALFWLMQRLVSPANHELRTVIPSSIIEPIKIIEEPPAPPPPPVQQATAPRAVAARIQSTAVTIAPLNFPQQPIAAPQLNLPVRLSGRLQSDGLISGVADGDALAAFAQGEDGFAGKDLVPISSARPRYPRAAAAREIEGWVEVIFVVSGQGKVSNVRVLDASPRGIFEDAAVHAMSRWLYAPFYQKGQPIAREATQIFRFKLDDIQELYLWDD